MSDPLQFALTAFVTLLVVVDPFSVVPIFVSLTPGMSDAQRRATVRRAVTVAFGVTLFFLLAGRTMLTYLGVSVHAFAISGGILLFVTAMPMLFGHRPRLQAPDEQRPGSAGDSVAVFPLAIPMLSGPGAIASTLLLADRAAGEVVKTLLLALAVGLVYVITLAVLRFGERLMARLGEGRINIITRVLGIVLAALAVQYVLNGLTVYYRSLVAP